MTTHINLLIIVAKTAILVLGGSITYYALRAYGRTGDPSLRALVSASASSLSGR